MLTHIKETRNQETRNQNCQRGQFYNFQTVLLAVQFLYKQPLILCIKYRFNTAHLPSLHHSSPPTFCISISLMFFICVSPVLEGRHVSRFITPMERCNSVNIGEINETALSEPCLCKGVTNYFQNIVPPF